MKKHRGAGNRGGKGMAGTGKRGDAKKPSIWKDKNYFGKHGFKKKNLMIIKTVSLSYIQEKINTLLAKKLIEQQGDIIIVDVKKLGFNKVLGNGKITKKFKITSPLFSAGAIEKIQAAGGEVIQPEKEATPAEKPQVKEEKTAEAAPEKTEELKK
ncbi:MAG: uL15m family ribosomal protein [Candidatus Woesearchaeota archaeon]